MHIESKGLAKSPFQWLQANRVMLTNTISLIGTTVVTSGLGFAYWWLAARQYSPEAVGLASAAVSTMMLLGSICVLGFGTLLITELPRQPEKQVSLICTGITVVTAVGAVVGTGFAVIAPSFSSQFAPLRANLLDILVFTIGVGFTSATAVLDQALVGILRGNIQFSRNAFFAIIKLIILFIVGTYLSYKTGMAVYASWVAGIVLSFFAVFVYSLLKRGWQGKAYLPQKDLLRKLGKAALQHHMLNLTLQVPTQLLPVLVTMLLSAKMNAWFYVSWMLASFLFLVPLSFTSVLHAMNSADRSALKQKARTTMSISFLFCLVACSVLFLGAKQILGVFGSAYADQASWCLRILVLAGFTSVIRAHYISFNRILDSVDRAMFITALGGTLEICGAVLGAHLGSLVGLCMGWVIATVVESVIMSPIIFKVIWPAQETEEQPLPTSLDEIQPIWLLDTTIMVALPPQNRASRSQVVSASARPLEAVEAADTVAQPAMAPSHSPSLQMSTTPFPSKGQEDTAIWDKETIMIPALSSKIPRKTRIRKIQ